MLTFEQELKELCIKYNIGISIDTPADLVANHLIRCLNVYIASILDRDEYFDDTVISPTETL